ncbi:hypothetical protein BSK59_15675 [Paenibacillus odorifer]|uniref:hypothetical protein n=1 Tax=Paenibacillus odorifer TaxID=189426 RepID=UPI00096C7960|nr:hypothetical protein [Paenibacillus odorifer]OME54019.1 hypothetical protein BSK59_15675 [Paenibacillus odorifer]
MSPEQVKSLIEKAMKNNRIMSKEEAEFAIEFVRELLETDIDRTTENEPHATNSIHEMKVSVQRVDDLKDMVDEVL